MKNRTSDIILDNINITSPDNKKLRLALDLPSPPSTTCDRKVANILTKNDDKTPTTTTYSAHSSLHTDITVSPTILVYPIFFNSDPLLSPHSLSYNIPSPGSAFSSVSPKMRLSEEINNTGTIQQSNNKDDSKLSVSLFDDYDSLSDFGLGSEQKSEENIKKKDSHVIQGQTIKSEEEDNISKDSKQECVQDDADKPMEDVHIFIDHESSDKQSKCPISDSQIIPSHARLIKQIKIKSLPPGLCLVPCAPPPGVRNGYRFPTPNTPSQNNRGVSTVSLSKNNNDQKDKLVTSLFVIEEPDIADKVKHKQALKHHNSKANEGLKNNFTIGSNGEGITATKVTAEEIPQPERMKKTPEIFMRTLKKEKAFTSLSNKFFLNSSLNIEAATLEQDSEEPKVGTLITLPTLPLTSFPEDDPDFPNVSKLGTGTILDKELSNSNINQVYDTPVGESKDNSIVFHVANSAMINQPLYRGNIPVKKQGNTTVLLTQESNRIVVHSMKMSHLRPDHSFRGRGRGRGVPASKYIPANQWTNLEDPIYSSVDNPQSVSVTEPPSVKTEHGIENTVSQDPSSCHVYSVYNGEGCSVEMNSVNPTNPNGAIGEGSKVLQFFYQNSEENVKIAFTPVLVNTEEEVNYVVALVTEKNDEFNRRHKVGRNKTPVQYYSSAVQARSILHPDVVRHIDKCFTKRGMKDAKGIGKKLERLFYY